MPSSFDPQTNGSPARPTIHGSPNGDGSALWTLNPEIHWSLQPKPCEWCRVPFVKKWKQAHIKSRFCGPSCSAKWRMSQPEHLAKVHTPEAIAKRAAGKSAWYRSGKPEAQAELARIRALNPTSDPEVRAKISRTLRAMNHAPSVRGGNGRGLTIPQQMMLDCLGEPWQAELCVSLGRRQPGYPTHYKLDLGNAERLVGIEVDGHSHHSRKALDEKKDEKLASLGWTVLRFWNQEILDWINTGKPTGSSISTTLESWGIRPIR